MILDPTDVTGMYSFFGRRSVEIFSILQNDVLGDQKNKFGKLGKVDDRSILNFKKKKKLI